MTLDPAALLAGPRGRQLCLEYIQASAADAGREAAEHASRVWWAGRGYESAGEGMLIVASGASGERFVPPVVTAADAASALEAIALRPPTRESLGEALAASVDAAMYWQPPDGTDVLAADPAFAPVLAHVAATIAASPEAAWWATPVDVEDQWLVRWPDVPGPADDAGPALAAWSSAAEAEEQQRALLDGSVDAGAGASGTWWSTPPGRLVHTTRALGATGPAELRLIEDSLGWETATAARVRPTSARVFEIDGADAWTDLCRRHPLVVTASRRHDWFHVTGRDGGWVQPDWSAVAREYDGVHLTTGGYLAAATRLLEVSEGWASVIAGWAPDATYWFVSVRVDEETQSWRQGADGWVRV